MKSSRMTVLVFLALAPAACGGDGDSDNTVVPSRDGGGTTSGKDGAAETGSPAKDPERAEKLGIDRFSEKAGKLMVRTAQNGLPAANVAVDFDNPPFVTQGLGPSGQVVKYYNFDVQATKPAPIYVLFRQGDDKPVAGQLNIIDTVPGDSGYNDFWQVQKVTVPAAYVANTVASMEEIKAAGFPIEATRMLVNCPVVPEGSTAKLRIGGGSPGLNRGWYKGKVVFYFTFEERALSGATVPVSPIYVTFNVNPDKAGGGPGSGFKTEPGTEQTHNVVATVPADAAYSPLWSVNAYDNADFGKVRDVATASTANILGRNVATVNCPVVELGAAASAVKDPDRAEKASIDRFSEKAGMLMVRNAQNGLPAANAAVDFDKAPFVTQGLGPSGQVVMYYNFDVQATKPALIYVLFRQGDNKPVGGQLNVIDAVPGDAGYNDFWQVQKVTVPAAYVTNTVASVSEIKAAGFPIETTQMLVNCPVVPEGSTAKLRIGGGSPGLNRGWYKGKVVFYFTFEERALSGATVPVSPIYVTFNVNPDQAGGGPGSGFRTEPGTEQTHNVVATVPADAGYSPLWSVNAYDNADFGKVHDVATASTASILGRNVATVNCPLVELR